MPPTANPIRYLSAEKSKTGDFGFPFTFEEGEIVYDAKTVSGPWATMTQTAYDRFSYPGGLGVGRGQKYQRNNQGHLILVEGF